LSESENITLANKAKLLEKNYWRVLLGNIIVFSFIYFLFPKYQYQFTQEDMFMEYLSAMLWFCSFFIGAIALSLGSITRIPYYCAVIPACGLLAFLDETSFLGLAAAKDNPASSGFEKGAEKSFELFGYQIDGVHDIFTILFKLWRDYGGLWGYILGSIILGVLIGLAITQKKKYMPKVMAFVRKFPAFNYFRLAVILVIFAQFLDLDLIPAKYGATFYEELLEANAGLTMCFASIALLFGVGYTPTDKENEIKAIG
jgi:hypothetical protein